MKARGRKGFERRIFDFEKNSESIPTRPRLGPNHSLTLVTGVSRPWTVGDECQTSAASFDRLNKFDRILCHQPTCHLSRESFSVSNGLITSSPGKSKSDTLRVTSAIPCANAVAAIIESHTEGVRPIATPSPKRTPH